MFALFFEANGLAATGRAPQLFVQVNTGEEAQKAGVMPAEADAIRAGIDEALRHWDDVMAGDMQKVMNELHSAT